MTPKGQNGQIWGPSGDRYYQTALSDVFLFSVMVFIPTGSECLFRARNQCCWALEGSHVLHHPRTVYRQRQPLMSHFFHHHFSFCFSLFLGEEIIRNAWQKLIISCNYPIRIIVIIETIASVRDLKESERTTSQQIKAQMTQRCQNKLSHQFGWYSENEINKSREIIKHCRKCCSKRFWGCFSFIGEINAAFPVNLWIIYTLYSFTYYFLNTFLLILLRKE